MSINDTTLARRMRRCLPGLAVVALAACTSPPQGSGHVHVHVPEAADAASASPYAGLQRREIRALSPQQVRDLREGRGMGFALPAELASYPGPMHVLEHARALALTADQLERTRALIAPMRSEAQRAGERWIEAEREIDRLFRERAATPEALDAALRRAALAQAEVRAAHLRTHIAQAAILTPEQVARYDVLRGYASGPVAR